MINHNLLFPIVHSQNPPLPSFVFLALALRSILSEISGWIVVYDVDVRVSGCPEGSCDEFHHIIDIFKLFCHVIWELDLELLLDEHCQLCVVELVEACVDVGVPSSHHCEFRLAF